MKKEVSGQQHRTVYTAISRLLINLTTHVSDYSLVGPHVGLGNLFHLWREVVLFQLT